MMWKVVNTNWRGLATHHRGSEQFYWRIILGCRPDTILNITSKPHTN